MDGKSDPVDLDAGPFGRPLFDSPSARALSRVAVVDVGSNSVRLVVFDGAARSPAYFYNEKIMCGLGAHMSRTGRLNPEGKQRALEALGRFRRLAEGMDTGPLLAVATAAVRDATDGEAFCTEVLEKTGLKLLVIDGREEARLSAQGVMLGWPGAYGLVCDMGGSSMELAEIRGGKVGARLSTPLGPLKLEDLSGGHKARKAMIRHTLDHAQIELGEQKDRLFLVGGSWRALARIDMARRKYPLHVLHEYRISPAELRTTLRYVETTDLETLRLQSGVSQARIGLIPLAAEVLREVLRTFRPHDIAISSYGIREGLLYEQMPQQLRDRDPLIEACRFAEHKDARVPGFGKVIYRFIEPIFKSCSPERKRIIRAACLLHDVTWRAHPDYRAEVCFDNATRANLGGLKHSERIYLGLALLHRYSNSREGSRFSQMESLLPESDRREAEVLGKAMRFTAMLWLKKDVDLGSMLWFPKKRVLELRLSRDASALFGEVARARFQSLATSLSAKALIREPR